MKTSNFIKIVLIIFLSACATTGYIPLETASKDLITQHIVQSKTTKSRIVKCFGNATRVVFDNSGNEVWIYQNKKLVSPANHFVTPGYSSIASNTSVKELVIVFDQNGVVSQYSMK